ncbi:MAG: alpha-amylase/4-alpha-glucanotransferase domain-containing protein [bacterium]
MGTVNFIFGIHNHQPVGNFSEVLEKAFASSYQPLLEVLEKHPRINWNLHVSGVLFDWLKVYKPEFLAKLKNMVSTGRLELLTGGYYEPILSSLPDSDKIGQIKKQSKFIKDCFGFMPKGLWLTERVWEPHLPKVLAEAGVEYTILDDAHFQAAGISCDKLTGYFVTEEQGVTVKLFPINKMLRYMIPFSTAEKCIDYFRQYAEKHDQGLLVMADDGEKFGLWPGTYKHVYEKGWLDKFFTLLDENQEWIKTWKFSDFSKSFPGKGMLYIPTASYFEMSEWTLPSDMEIKFEHFLKRMNMNDMSEEDMSFLRGALWRNFLYKYPESNAMHKKMLLVSQKVHKLESVEGNKNFISDAVNHLWAGQCNCAYWHGVFGGLYLPHLREAIYSNLIKAESLTDNGIASSKSKNYWHLIEDFNCDGFEEVLIEGKQQNFYFAPHRGGSVIEWDYKPNSVNLTNVITRRKEAYHEKLEKLVVVDKGENKGDGEVKTIHGLVKTKQSDLKESLFYDWYDRLTFLDHFFHPFARLDEYEKSQYGEQGDFVLAQYKWSVHEEKDSNIILELSNRGNVWVGDCHCPIFVSKRFEFLPDSEVKVLYTIKNCCKQKVDLWFGVELNLLLGSEYKEKKELFSNEFLWNAAEKNTQVKMCFNNLVNIWQFPIETVSQSEDGFEKTFQGISITPHCKFGLDIDSSFLWEWRISASTLANG